MQPIVESIGIVSYRKSKSDINTFVKSNTKETIAHTWGYTEELLQLVSARIQGFSHPNVRGQENGHYDQHLNADDQQF
jgi:hypothetical protein